MLEIIDVARLSWKWLYVSRGILQKEGGESQRRAAADSQAEVLKDFCEFRVEQVIQPWRVTLPASGPS